MPPSKLSSAYIATIVVFIIILVFGTFYLNWGQSHYGFALIIFFLVLVGIRLDEIAQELRKMRASLEPVENPREPDPGHLAAIRSTLAAIQTTLERLETNK